MVGKRFMLSLFEICLSARYSVHMNACDCVCVRIFKYERQLNLQEVPDVLFVMLQFISRDTSV